MQYYYNSKDLPLSTSVINAYIVQVLCNQAVASMRRTEALVSVEISWFFFVFFACVFRTKKCGFLDVLVWERVWSVHSNITTQYAPRIPV